MTMLESWKMDRLDFDRLGIAVLIRSACLLSVSSVQTPGKGERVFPVLSIRIPHRFLHPWWDAKIRTELKMENDQMPATLICWRLEHLILAMNISSASSSVLFLLSHLSSLIPRLSSSDLSNRPIQTPTTGCIPSFWVSLNVMIDHAFFQYLE